MKPVFKKHFAFGPNPACPWAEKMVLNPAMVQDPDEPDTIHMLFRSTGACPERRIPGRPMPYPIFVGYAVSHDRGESWDCDFSRPAMELAFQFDPENPPIIEDAFGRKMFDYTNGSVEDPRLFYFENELYCCLAGRSFPPGPYWDHDDPLQCIPEGFEIFGRAVAENYTVSLLYKVDLDALRKRDYEHSFTFIAPLHEPDMSDNRDVVLFPRRLNIGGKPKIVCIHRPKWPWHYEFAKTVARPSIFMAAADSPADFSNGKAVQTVYAVKEFPWEANRIGASWAPLEIEPGLWLLPYHGKQDNEVGYTQSFMLLKENGRTFPDIVARPSQRLLYATEAWELEGDFTIPCLFTCSGVLRDDGTLLMGYGAADAKVGMAEVRLKDLISWLKKDYERTSFVSGSCLQFAEQ